MNTRLFPKTSNPSILEILADVPPGTFAELQRINEQLETTSNKAKTNKARNTAYEAFLSKLAKYPDCARLFRFTIEGWGKFNVPDCVGKRHQSLYNESGSLSINGNTEADVMRLLAFNGIPLYNQTAQKFTHELIEKIYWG